MTQNTASFLRSFDVFLSVTLPAAIREDNARREREHRIRCERIIRRLDSLKIRTESEETEFFADI